MTTGPLYLVSACSSAEEFVAAFRRYAERTGLFVPLAEPLPPGRRGRFALTLKDGGVMIEGDADVVSAASKAVGLHGRAGMTLKFVDVDEPSKAMLDELERARLRMKPAPTTAVPRKAEVPAEPRASVPPVGGRIDAANALAECVMIGDASGLKDVSSAPLSPNKFVIPTIPQMGAARPKTPSTPPALTARPKPPTNAPPPTPAVGAKATVMGMPPMERLPATDSGAVKAPPPVASIPAKGESIGKATTLGMPAVRLPAEEAKSPAISLTQTISSKSPPPGTAKPPRHPTPYAPMPIVRLPAADADSERTDLTTTPIDDVPRSTPLGVATLSAVPVAPVAAEDSGRAYVGPPPKPEPPIVAAAPATPVTSRSGGLRASEIMAAIAPSDDWTMTPDAAAPTVVPADAKPKTDADDKPAAPAEASAPVKSPTGDWTISTDPASADGWTAPAKVEPPQQPATGNRVIAVASAQALEAVEWEEKPTGIGEPLVQIDPTLMEPLKPMLVDDEPPANIVSSLPTDIPPPPLPSATGQNHAMQVPPPLAALQLTPLPPPPEPMAPQLQLHATGPQPPLPLPPNVIPTPPPMQAPPGLFANMQPYMPPPPVIDASGHPRPDLTDGNTGFFRETGEVPRYAHDQSVAFSHPPMNKRRTLLIVMAGAIGVTAVLIVVVLALGSHKHDKGGTGSGARVAHTAPADAAVAMVQPPQLDAAAEVPPPIDAAQVPDTCAVEVSSIPSGADISIGNDASGTTPATLHLPCGVETKLTFHKPKFPAVVKDFTASPDNRMLQVKFVQAMFSIKVTSVPPGATITVRGKVVGITPTTIKIAAFTATSITLSKDGYQADVKTVAPRQNNATHFVTLKKAARPQHLR